MTPMVASEEVNVAAREAHRPVMLEEVVRALSVTPSGTYVDGTLGPGGHAQAVLEQLGPDGVLFGIDRDTDALDEARERLGRFGERFVAIRGDHQEIVALLRAHDVFALDGVLLDLGVSSLQLDRPERGFSFREDGPLDMRMSADRGETAAELLARWSEAEIRECLQRFGEERRAGAIAREIVKARQEQPLVRTAQLAELVQRVLGPQAQRYRIHPATRTFQALRIAVNGEVTGLGSMIHGIVAMLKRGGRLVVISYHSLEDRAVKTAFRELANRCTCPPRLPVCACGKTNWIRTLSSKPIRPTAAEVADNPRARSARMRIAERL